MVSRLAGGSLTSSNVSAALRVEQLSTTIRPDNSTRRLHHDDFATMAAPERASACLPIRPRQQRLRDNTRLNNEMSPV